VNDWWKAFFDQDYLRIWEQVFTDDANAKQAAELWSALDLKAGCRLLDAPCGGAGSRALALLGAIVLGVDQAEGPEAGGRLARIGKHLATKRELFPGSPFGANFRIADHSTRTPDNALCAVYCDGLVGVPRDIPKPNLEASR